MNEHLIDTVFAIFDEDGDGLLSYKEFIAIMRVCWNIKTVIALTNFPNYHSRIAFTAASKWVITR